MRAGNACANSPPKAYSRNRSGTEDCTQRNADLESGREKRQANRRVNSRSTEGAPGDGTGLSFRHSKSLR